MISFDSMDRSEIEGCYSFLLVLNSIGELLNPEIADHSEFGDASSSAEFQTCESGKHRSFVI